MKVNYKTLAITAVVTIFALGFLREAAAKDKDSALGKIASTLKVA